MDSTYTEKIAAFTYSTPAKFILSGEHSVAYGKDALVATLDIRTYGDWIVTKNTSNDNTALNVNLSDLKKVIILVNEYILFNSRRTLSSHNSNPKY